jgi:hypothetical protein
MLQKGYFRLKEAWMKHGLDKFKVYKKHLSGSQKFIRPMISRDSPQV